MDRTTEMVEVLEDFIISKVIRMKEGVTSPADLSALAELVTAVNHLPRTIEFPGLKESVMVTTSAAND